MTFPGACLELYLVMSALNRPEVIVGVGRREGGGAGGGASSTTGGGGDGGVSLVSSTGNGLCPL